MIRILLILSDLIADVLEAHQRLDDLATPGARDSRAELAHHDRLHDRCCRRQLRLVRLEQEVREQGAKLIARQQDVLVPLTHADADAVAVRIRADDDVRPDFRRELQAKRQRALLFRIRRLHRRKIPVRHFLRMNDMDIGKARAREHLAHGLHARAVQRRVDDAQRPHTQAHSAPAPERPNRVPRNRGTNPRTSAQYRQENRAAQKQPPQ